ncbi:MAG: TonB-dependent receptor [Ignavibacteriae bacterium]|nr:TonB-dependent receptor [Ignavibacteriota bacterium]
MKFLIGLFAFIIFNSFQIAQSNDSTKFINGIILDSQTNEPLPFANIGINNFSLGTSSDVDGKFSMKINSKSAELIFSYVGYKTSTIKLENLKSDEVNFIFLNPISINLQEVTVFSNSSNPSELTQLSNLSLQSERIREISSAMPDILRSVQALPGVVVNNEFKADFNVRGGNQDENLVLVNGTQVYEPYHIKEAANASVGIFNVDLMKKVEIITGGFSAKYGDKMSSVLNIEYREGNKEKYSGAASLSLAFLDGYIEGPISEKSSFIFGVRKSYMEYVLSLIDYEDIKSVKPSFYDLQGVVSYSLTLKNKLLFEFIHAGDDFSYKPERIYSTKIENEINTANYFSTLLDVKSKNILSSKTLLNFEISYYDQIDEENRLFNRFEKINYNDYDSLQTIRLTYDSLRIKTLEFKSELNYQLNSFYEIQNGFSFQNINYLQNANDFWTYIGNRNNTNPVIKDTLTRIGSYGNEKPIDVSSYKFAAYLENILSLTNSLTVNFGGRIDYFDINKDLTFSPRINTAYKFEDGTLLKAAWGYFYQSPIYAQLSSSVSSDTNTQSQKSIHYILGLEKQFNFADNYFLKLKLETYYKDYSNLISSQFGVFERLTYSRKNDAIGNSKGIDLYAILNYDFFYGWLSYGYMQANENKLNDNYGEYPRYTNQTHTISIVTNFAFGNNWNLSLKAYYGSGFPYTPKTAVKDEQTGIWDWKSGEIHSADLPAYKRVDLRISKIFVFDKFRLNSFLDVSNVFNFKNVQRYEFDNPGLSKPSSEEILLWPIIPSFGIRFEF